MEELTLEQFKDDIQRQMTQFSPQALIQWQAKVTLPVMVNMVIISFLGGKDPDQRSWKSPAAETKHRGKFAKGYDIRPSGASVDSQSLRLTDTGAFRNSYGGTKLTAYEVIVGPRGQRNIDIASRAEAPPRWGPSVHDYGEGMVEVGAMRTYRRRGGGVASAMASIGGWDNKIVGWSARRVRIMEREIIKALDEIARTNGHIELLTASPIAILSGAV